MSGTLPTSPSFSSVVIKSNNPNIVTMSTSGRRQVKTQQTQFWSFTGKFPPLTRSQWGPIAAFVVKQRGSYESFTMILPEYSTTYGALTTEPVTIVNTETIGATAIELTSGSLTMPGALKAGDFIKFAGVGSPPVGGHNKVYMVVDDVDFSGGTATMNIEPGLVSVVATTMILDYKDVEFTVFLPNDVQEFNTGLASIATYELDMREAL